MNQDIPLSAEFDLRPCYKNMQVTFMKLICTLLSMCIYITDVTFDILAAIKHSENGDESSCGLTVFFIVLPGITMTVFSVLWYIADESSDHLKASNKQWVIRIIFLALMMAPVLRNLEALYFAARSIRTTKDTKREYYARRMIFENTDAALLRLFQAFLECAPQVILQLYVFARAQYYRPNEFSETDVIQMFCIFTSIISMAWSVSSYQCTLRESLDYKNDINSSICIFPFLWRFFEITARLLTLGLFTSILLPFFSLLIVVHFMVMFVWIRIINTDFCGNRPAEFLYNIVLSFMHMFCYISAKDNASFRRCIFYYPLIFVENTILISVWYTYYLEWSMLRVPAIVVVFMSFSLAICVMILYYTLLHPTRGKYYGKPSRRNGNDTLAQLQSVADGFVVREEIMRMKAESENRQSSAQGDAKFFVDTGAGEGTSKDLQKQ